MLEICFFILGAECPEESNRARGKGRAPRPPRPGGFLLPGESLKMLLVYINRAYIE
jgi:hypothetical protein